MTTRTRAPFAASLMLSALQSGGGAIRGVGKLFWPNPSDSAAAYHSRLGL
ncbi:hypothetical protein [Mycoavidus cysteinexigens]|nr:hypothetical protein [Mycoavidus cysteinexigens]